MPKFQPGQSGNPSGRPKENFHLKELAQEKTEEALKTLVQVMLNKKAPSAARVSAATAILDRGYGKPVQAMEHSGLPAPALPSDPKERERRFLFLMTTLQQALTDTPKQINEVIEHD